MRGQVEKGQVEFLNFEKVNIPRPYESREVSEDRYVIYGYDNLYPYFLLRLYNESAIHSSIINVKSTYIIGDGLRLKGDKEFDIQVNSKDSFNELVDKVVKDYLIFNYFGIEVLYNALNEPIEYHHIPAHNLRTNKSKTKFWYSEDWTYKKDLINYDVWRPGSSDTKSKVFFYDGYYPTVNRIYPVPDYAGGLKAVQTDVAITDFNLNNIKNHFSVSTIISFFEGANVPDDIKKKIIEDLKDSYTGENGKKLIVNFLPKGSEAPRVENLMPGDWDKAYTMVREANEDTIYKSHQVTSPMLISAKTQGQLGGATELEIAYEIFKSNYILGKRREIQFALSRLFNVDLEFIDRPLFKTSLSDSLKEKVFTINEIRKTQGLPPIEGGDRLPVEAVKVQPTQVMITEQPKDDSEIIKKKLTEEDYNKIAHLGILKDEFDVVEDGEQFQFIKVQLDKESDIADYVIKNDIKGLKTSELRDLIEKDLDISISESDLNKTLNKLKDSGIINVEEKDGRVNIKPPVKPKIPQTRKVEIFYSYEVRPGLGAPIIPTSRDFCVKLIENNRLYSREDIQTMSDIFGYDIYTYGGGYFYNPKTDETTPFCRHYFKSNAVVRKSNQ